MLCPNCGTENRERAKFCDECGFPLGGAIARVASTLELGDEASSEETRVIEALHAAEQKPVETADGVVSEPAGGQLLDDDAMGGQQAAGSGVVPAVEAEAALMAADATEPVSFPPMGESGHTEHEFMQGAPGEDAVRGLGSPEELQDDALKWVEAPVEAQPAAIDASLWVEPEMASSNTMRIRPQAGEWPIDSTLQMPPVQGDNAASRDYLQSEVITQRRGGKGVIVAVLLVLVAAAAIVAGSYAAGLWGGKPIPDVKGMTENDARELLERDGFAVRAMSVKSDEIEGLVLLMDPDAGTRADGDSEVVIHVASARLVPEVVGLGLEEATAALADAGYSQISVTYQKDDGDEGVVLGVSPEQGARAKSSMEITLVVSEAFRVPDISGMGIDEAREAIEAEGLSAQVVYVENYDYEAGTLMGTEPETGAKVSGGDLVTIQIARNRALELEELTESLLAPGSTITLDGFTYDIVSLRSVRYEGDNTVAFTATARPKITFFGETFTTSSTQQIEGEVSWSDDDTVLGIY